MNKRELVKWLEKKKEMAMAQAKEQRQTVIDTAKEVEYTDIDLQSFIDSVVPLYQQILKNYEDFMNKVDNIPDISLARYYYRFGYSDLKQHYTDNASYKKVMEDTIQIRTQRFTDAKHAAYDAERKVSEAYDTVIQTVKNLPNYKDGMEYLSKLGFNLSEIRPLEVKKQLPATISVNVETQYLLLGKKEADEQTN